MNKVYKVIFNKSLNVWTAVSELAKGQSKSSVGGSVEESRLFSNVRPPYYFVDQLPRLTVLCLSMWAYNNLYAITPEECLADCVVVSTSAELKNALESGTATRILMSNDITLTADVSVQMINRPNLVLDGGGFSLSSAYGTGAASHNIKFTKQNSAAWTEQGTFTFENFTKLTSGTSANNPVIQLDPGSGSSASNINVIFNNINTISDSMLAVMGNTGNGGTVNTNSLITFGTFTDKVEFSAFTFHQLILADKIKFDGKFTLNSNSSTGQYNTLFWNNGVISDGLITFSKNADVDITVPTLTGGYRTSAYQYLFEDGAKFKLTVDQL